MTQLRPTIVDARPDVQNRLKCNAEQTAPPRWLGEDSWQVPRSVTLAALLLCTGIELACTGPDRSRPADPTALARAALSRMDDRFGRSAVVVHASGLANQSAELQGRQAGRPDSSEFRESLARMPSGELGHEYEHDRVDGTREWVREVFEPGSKTIHILEEGFSVRLTSGPELDGSARLARRFPHTLLTEVLDSDKVTLVAGGVDAPGGLSLVARYDSAPDLVMSFESSDTTLRAVSYRTTLPGLGDVTVRWTYGDYRRVEGLGLLPYTYGIEVAEMPFLSMSVDSVVTNTSQVRAFFDRPEGFEPPFDVPPAAGGGAADGASVEQVTDGVYIVNHLRSGFNPMFIEFRDFVVAVDAPAGYPLLAQLPAGDVAPGPAPDWLSRRYIRLIQETLPGKPVKYVVLTHFHNDHAGGVRAFLAEGATALVAGSDEEATRRYYDAPHSGAPDALSRRPTPLRLEVVSDRFVISDGARNVEVLALGPNPHTQDMLVVNLPSEQFMFVSDLVTALRPDDFAGRNDQPPQEFLLRWLAATGLDPARIYTMHGSGFIERSVWRRAGDLLGPASETLAR